jgi:hypothetical protein
LNLLLSLLLFAGTSLAMPGGAFDSLAAQVSDASFSSEKLDTISSAASTNTFTAAQVARLLGEISMSGDQLEALAVLAPQLEDPNNAAPIVAVFSFSSDQKKAAAMVASARAAAPPAAAAPAQPASRAGAGARAAAPTPDCAGNASLPPLEVRFTSTFSQADMDALVSSLEAVTFSSDRVAVLDAALKGRVEGLSSAQVRRLLGAFGFNADMVQAVQSMDKHLLGMTSAEVVSVLEHLSMSGDKLAVLKVLRDTITDADHKFVILDAFNMSADKTKARRILNDVRPRSYLFGTVNSQQAVFVVDVSGSMEARFTTSQGRTLSRLDFVRCELVKVLTEQLPPTARFNIVLFSDGVETWRSGLQPASSTSVQQAVAFLGSARPHGRTNVHGGLKAGFIGGPDAVYLLTDGTPTAGDVRDSAGIVAAAQQWSGGGTPVHGIAFLMGDYNGDDKAASRALMHDVAEATGGIYRALE